jgi:ABC-type proline/glycine betaine transport system ATPase subunit
VVLCLKFNGNQTEHDRYWQKMSFYFLNNVRKCTVGIVFGAFALKPQSTNFKSANNSAVFDPILIFLQN